MQRVTEHSSQVDTIPIVRAVQTPTHNASQYSRPGRSSFAVPLLAMGGGLLVAFASLAVTLVCIFVLPRIRGTEIPLANGGQLYYKSTVTKDEAQKLATHLNASIFKDLDHRATVQVNREGNTYQLRFVVKQGVQPTEFQVLMFQAYGMQVSKEVFNGAPVEVHLCDESLETIRVLPPLAK
jgi:hypothetical protein